jgi:hypothetical protein
MNEEWARISPNHALLVTAACAPTQPARLAWERWSRATDLEDADAVAQQLLIEIACRADVLLSSDLLQGRVRGLYRHAWTANTLMLQQMRPTVDALANAGVGFGCLDRAGLAPYSQSKVVVTTGGPLDVVIRKAAAATASHVLSEAGHRKVEPANPARGQAGTRLRVWTRALPVRDVAAEDAVWSRAAPPGDDHLGYRLRPADLVLRALVRAARGHAYALAPIWAVHMVSALQVTPDTTAMAVADQAAACGVVSEALRGITVLSELVDAESIRPAAEALRCAVSARTGPTRAGRLARRLRRRGTAAHQHDATIWQLP